MDDSPRLGPELDRPHPLVFGGRHFRREVPVDVGAICRDCERLDHAHDEVGLAELPARREFRRFRRRSATLGRTRVDPLGDQRHIRIVQSPLALERSVPGRGVPRRHVSGLRHGADQLGSLRGILVGQQGEGRGLPLAVAGRAVLVHDRSDLAVERDGFRLHGICGEQSRVTRERESASEDISDYEGFRHGESPELRIARSGMKQPTA